MSALKKYKKEIESLHNLWLPLRRLLQNRCKTFANGIVLDSPKNKYKLHRPVTKLVAEAKIFERKGQWLLALENWSQVRQSGISPYKQRSLLQNCSSFATTRRRFSGFEPTQRAFFLR